MSTLLEGFDALQTAQSASFPASSHQQRLWFLAEPSSHNIALLSRLDTTVDPAALASALNAEAALHEALRTSLHQDGDQLVQCIAPAEGFVVPFAVVDGNVEAVLEQEQARPFDLAAAPFLRATLIRSDAGRSATLLLVAHTAMLDRSSLHQLAERLTARLAGQDTDAPELHYVDYSEWQRTMPESELQKLVSYWQYQLRDLPSILELPTANPRQAKPTYTAATSRRHIPLALDQQISRFCAATGTDRFNVFYSAFVTLLHRYSAQADLVVGTWMDQRGDDTRQTLGPLSNLVALRARFEATDTTADVLGRNSAMLDAARAHSALPADQLARLINPQNDPSRTALFDAFFQLDETAAHDEQNRGAGRYDLSLSIHRDGEALVSTIDFNRDLHDAWFIEQFAKHYERVLAAITGDAQAIAAVELLDAAERQQLLVDWATRDAEFDANAVIHGIFEEQVRIHADRIAATALDEHVTYRELNARANRLAHWLLAKGIEREHLVAVHVAPSVDTLVAILGILKAGAAYLPLDVNAPAGRITYQLQDSGCGLLLTTSPADCAAFGFEHVIDLDAIRDEVAACDATNPNVATSPTDLAYCIYTSGSTGMPKGALIEHGHVVRLMKNSDFDFAVSEHDVWTIFHNFNFDFSVWEMYGALLYGGRAVVVMPEAKHNPETFFELLASEGVTILNQTPSAFYRLLPFAGKAPLAVRYVIFGGEGLDPSRLKGWQHAYPQTQLVNGYGITETTVFSTMQPVDAQMLERSAGIIGRPMATTICYVLDEQLRPVPAGVPGQIFVGGLGVSRGYLNRPELTADRFIADPFSDREHARMYKSGDIARWLPGGRLEFFGRADNQVQLRGYRVELGEIESQLVKQDGVKDAVVVVREDAHGEQYLAGYIVAATDDQQELSATLRHALKSVLPPYMVPSAFVFLDELPLTANGKLNKKALPDPDVQSQQVYVAPETAVEQKLAGIWQEILKLTGPISATADFFSLGGHSLLAMRAISAINAAFDAAVPVKAIFEHNTIRDLSVVIEQQVKGSYSSIPLVSRAEPLPLSFAQQRLWFIDRLEEGSAQYNMPVALRLTGNLEIDALQRSFDEIVARHEVIRSTYHLEGEAGVQVIHPARPVAMVRTDLSQLDANEREARIQQLLRAETERPFDLASDLMLRVQLVTVSATEHILLFTMHHIASDGWSLGVLIKELVTLYEGHCLGIQADLTPLPIQYADFAAWQRRKMQGEELERQLSYWKRQLANAPGVHSLPLDRPRPAQQQFAGAFHQTRLDQNVLEGLNRLASEHQATLFMVLNTAFSLLLSRWSGAPDIVVGTPTAGRNHADTEALIGFFVSTLVLRTEVSDEQSFHALLQRGRQTILDAFSNQDIPFEMLVDEVRPGRSLSYSPMFQIMFALQNNERVDVSLADLQLAGLSGDHEVAKFDLSLSAGETGDGLTLTWNYATGLFEAESIQRMAASFGVLLEAIVANPEVPSGQLPILTKAEEAALWAQGGEALPYTAVECIHEAFEAQAARTPDAVAVVFGDRAMTYAELNAEANRLAHFLREKQVGPDMLVGVCVERSLEMVVGLMAILKAGGAYVPLDPSYPMARLEVIMQDSAVQYVLTQSHLAARMATNGREAILLDRLDAFASYPATDIPVAESGVTPSNLAYLIYTSGSTGVPKGVEICHTNTVAFMEWAAEAFTPAELRSVLASTSLNFDLSIFEIFVPLAMGHRVVVVENALALLEQDVDVSLINTVPSAAQVLVEHRVISDGVLVVNLAGEPLPRKLVNALFEHTNTRRVCNLYGPSEDTTYSTWASFDGPLEEEPSIGRAVAYTQLYVLTPSLQLCPRGHAGELYIGGAGLARGYRNKPELTADRFIANPFGEGRLYRTGDLVRYRADGGLEFIGRIDDQVKLRGFRIELGEIKSRLVEQPEIKEAVVVARGEGAEKRLVAYVIPAPGAAETGLVEAVERRLRQVLPDYMVPSAFVILEAFPLTSNGKIDKKALPEPNWQRNDTYVAPRNAAEATLAEIWGALLKLERVGIEDNFFAIGGDSILSIQVVSRANQAGISITTRQLFEHQTIAALAAQARQAVKRDMPQEAATGAVSLLPIQREFLAEDARGRNHYNQAVLLETPAGFDETFLRDVVTALLARHDALRLRFEGNVATHEPFSAAMLAASAIVERGAVDVTARCRQWQQSFDLTTGPLFRAIFFAEANRLFLVAHHIVVDGVSWRILLGDLEQAYHQHLAGEAVKLAPKTSSFQQWGAALEAYAATLNDERAFWLAQYDHAVPALPMDRQTPEAPGYLTTRKARIRMTVAETQALLQRCAPVYRTTINELLLSGVYLGMRRWSNATGLRLALEGHGREELFDQLDTTQTVGWFTTLFPLTLHSESGEVSDVIKAVKEQYRALPNKGIGFGLLRWVAQDAVLAERAAANPPQVVFNYLGQFDQTVNHESAMQAAAESTGSSISPERARQFPLGLNGMVANGTLEFALDYSVLQYDAETIETLAKSIEEGLRAVVDHCLFIERGGYTPSDFPLATVSQVQLDAWQQAYPQLTRLYPATGMQEGMFFHGQLDRSAYVTQIFPTFEGELSATHFRRAWEIVCNRHDIFRTAFVGEGDGLHQLVVAEVNLPWQEHDWRDVPAEQQRARFARFRAEDKAAGFDFASAPLQRIALFRMADDQWQMLWTHHHMLLDGWCTPLVYKEVMLAYHGLVRGEAVQLPEAPVYENYIQWLQRRNVSDAHTYWRQYLADVEAPTPLVIDTLPAESRSGVEEQVLAIDLEGTQRLEAFAKANHTTVNTLMQLAWGYVLHRYSGESQVVFGALTSGRPAEVRGVEEMIGLFINTIPVKVAFERNATTASLVGDLHRAFQASQEQSWLPLNEIQKQSAAGSGVALFDSLVVFENYPIEAAMAVSNESRSTLRVSGGASDERTNYKLTFIVALSGQLKIRCSYPAETFSRETIERLLAHLELVLGELTTHESIAEIDLVTDAERAQLAAWNVPTAEYPRDKSIAALFEEQVRLAPDAIAVSLGDAQLTYAELNARANRLAHRLVELGVGADTLVGLRVERSLEMLVAMVAILKAGGAYLPLDPNYPAARLQAMIDDSNVAIVLTQEELAADLSHYSSENLRTNVAPASLAYVMYTSGSTGVPKGTMVEHRSVVRLVLSNNYVPLSAETRMLQASSVSFDAATFEIWGALLNGGTLVLYPERYLDLTVLNRELEGRQINTMWLTAGVFEQWSQSLPRFAAPRYILAGGDVVNPRAVERVYSAFRQTQVINGYGPTENTTFTCCHVIPRNADFSRPVPLGKAINGTTVHVLDANLNPVPLGAIGELYAGGDGVARGYWNRPELTAEKFIVAGSARLYRTGDLVRYLPDGTLEFIGRADDQVKIRGFRIELGEIEAQLLRHPSVREAVVIARGDRGAKRLVAYVVAIGKLSVSDVEAALAQQLPEYMLPSAIVVLESFPLTANGKIDRKALPEPEWQLGASYSAPRNETEAKLAEIWAKLLRLERVGIEDNFFAIGGDSILSIQAVSRANQAGIAITTRQLFENPTIAALAGYASNGTVREMPQEAVGGALTLLPIQQQFLEDDAHARHHFNQSLLFVTPEGFDARFLRDMVRALYERHDALRLTFGETADHRELTEAMLDAAAIVESGDGVTERCAHYQQAFDLAHGPLFRAVWFPQAKRLLLVAHHIIVDGVSWRILVSDIEQAFAQHRAGETIALAPKTSSYQQWGAALAAYASSDAIAAEKAYWLGQYDAAVDALPVDRATTERLTYSSSALERVRLDAAATQALLQQCGATYRTTINELLLSGVYLGMRNWTQSSGLRLALEGHGREELFDNLDTTQTVGWFTTVFPLTLQSATASVADVIKSVKEQYRALPNHGLGFGVLRYLAQDEELVAKASAYRPQLVFNYLGQLDQSVERDTALQPASEGMGPQVDVERVRPYQLGLNGRVVEGVLEFTLDYSRRQYDEATMASLARSIESGLRGVIAHCLATERGDYTPSDFPLATVSQTRLDEWQQAYPNLINLYPATGMQQGMFFHGLLDRGAYVTQIYPRFAGELSIATLRRAWELVSNRHDTFRTAFVGQEERLHQLVVSDATLPWVELDWRTVPVDEQLARFEQFRAEDKAAGFDFAKPPLQRITVIRLADDRWQLLWTHHHMLLDGWCAPLVYKEVMYAYERLSRGEAVRFPDAPVYANYIQWLQQRDVTEAHAYWREALANLEAPTPLVVDKLANGGNSGFHEQTLSLSAADTQRLEAFARAQQTTVNTLMQLAWSYLLHRYSGESQICFGAITSGRPAEVAGVEQMVGLFINTIPVKVAFEQNAATIDLVRELHRGFQASQEHSYLPLTAIQQQSAIASGVPLFDSLLAFENYPVDTAVVEETASRASNLRVESSATDERTNYKLTLIVTCAAQLNVRCGYMGEVFANETVERMLGHLAAILTKLPDAERIDAIDVLSTNERARFAQWNDTAAEIPTDVCLHEMFVERAVAFPDAVATRDANGTVLTYDELFRRAIVLSRQLKALDVQTEELVGVRLPKGSDQVIATLGIMMAGGAYLPMEMNWPVDRCTSICNVANARYVITNAETIGTTTSLSLPAAPAEGELRELANELSYEGLTDKLAYVIFTSGSTGTPKGVAIEHAAAVNTCIDINQRYAIDHNDKVLAVSALSFDLSVYDIFGVLAVGGEVIFPAPEKATDPRHWAELVETHGITLWDTVPASADLLATHYELEGRACNAPVRTIMMSGDWIHPALPKRLWNVFPTANTWSLGGATEASIWSINYPIVADTSGLKSVPYGMPLANQSFHILDKNLRQVPVGVIGELFIGGRGVARCYYGDAERTAKSFIRHEQLGRLYRTGDMGRYMADGNIEFIGRVDHQVKIRGFRIELGEIEAVLSRNEAVEKVIVEVRGTGNDKYLAAYVIPLNGQEVDIASLKQAARAALPTYMLPAAYVILETLPLTANGKVDKKALPEPGNQLLADYVAPSTETEATLAVIWRELLGSTREIGVTENFFEAGGNSLLAMQILYRVQDRLGCRLDIADVFSYQTIAMLAKFIDAMTHIDADVTTDEELEELAY
ncbi:MAG TPA: amino acid adenylation domain-containing protein [Thermoanaerobaculia bacterium]